MPALRITPPARSGFLLGGTAQAERRCGHRPQARFRDRLPAPLTLTIGSLSHTLAGQPDQAQLIFSLDQQAAEYVVVLPLLRLFRRIVIVLARQITAQRSGSLQVFAG